MNKLCRVCGAETSKLMYRLDKFEILRCPRCQCSFLSLNPTVGELKEMYSPLYFEERRAHFFQNAAFDPATGSPDGPLYEFRYILHLLSRYRGKGRLLDVGCGTGVFLSLARNAQWETFGVELSSYAAAFARDRLGLKHVFEGTLVEAHFPDGFFDAVTVLDVFEHLPEPRAELQEIRRTLKVGGLLLINTPNEDSLLRKMTRLLYLCSLGKFTYPVEKLYHQYHLCYYSLRGLGRALEDGGFTIRFAEKKPLIGSKGRASPLVRRLLKALSLVERMLDMEYELLIVAQKAP